MDLSEALVITGTLLVILGALAGWVAPFGVFILLAIAGNAVYGLNDLLYGSWYVTLAHAFIIAGLYMLWRRRRRRDRAPRNYGYKARAWIARLVGKLRDTVKRRPTLRPVPQGA